MVGCRLSILLALGLWALGMAGATPLAAQEQTRELSPRLQTFFEKYMRKGNRAAFALSIDGKAAGFSYCPQHAMCGFAQRRKLERTALNSCRSASDGVACKIYAWRGNIVWEGPLPGGKKHCTASGQRDALSDADQGRGDVTLSADVVKAYERFKAQDGTGYFAMPPTGASYYYQICEFTDCDFETCLERARRKCRGYAGSACQIMADKIGVVWRGELRGPDGTALPGSPLE